MKLPVLTLLILFHFVLKAQKEALFIEEFSITDQVLSGSIDQKYPITLYLKFEEYSPENWLSYSVSGWYYYNTVKKKIPLVGVYSGRLVLYSFADPVRADSVKQMLSSVPNPWEATDDLMSRSGFTEKFDFDYNDYMYKGTWENGLKQLDVSFNVSRIDLDQKQEFLVIPLEKNVQKHIDLSRIGPTSYGYSIFASKYDAGGSKVLLKYEISSTANPNGMCGAGMGIGFVLLHFDNKGTLTDYREEPVESCLGNLWSESAEVPGTNEKKMVYKVTDSEEKVRTVTIDGTNFSISIK